MTILAQYIVLYCKRQALFSIPISRDIAVPSRTLVYFGWDIHKYATLTNKDPVTSRKMDSCSSNTKFTLNTHFSFAEPLMLIISKSFCETLGTTTFGIEKVPETICVISAFPL